MACEGATPSGYRYAKRALDLCVSAALLLLLAPLGALIALVIALDDGGPILYFQMRVGKHGRLFRFYKFRSMVRNADALKSRLSARNEAGGGPIFKMARDPRVTRVGRMLRKYSLDELPQLLNVLCGHMSLVGPRPHLPSEVAKYTERQKMRLQVEPGLICLREVSGRSRLSFDRWIETDLQYIEQRCFVTDLRILARAIPAVLKAEGAY